MENQLEGVTRTESDTAVHTDSKDDPESLNEILASTKKEIEEVKRCEKGALKYASVAFEKESATMLLYSTEALDS